MDLSLIKVKHYQAKGKVGNHDKGQAHSNNNNNNQQQAQEQQQPTASNRALSRYKKERPGPLDIIIEKRRSKGQGHHESIQIIKNIQGGWLGGAWNTRMEAQQWWMVYAGRCARLCVPTAESTIGGVVSIRNADTLTKHCFVRNQQQQQEEQQTATNHNNHNQQQPTTTNQPSKAYTCTRTMSPHPQAPEDPPTMATEDSCSLGCMVKETTSAQAANYTSCKLHKLHVLNLFHINWHPAGEINELPIANSISKIVPDQSCELNSGTGLLTSPGK